jgi:hypothetical protein
VARIHRPNMVGRALRPRRHAAARRADASTQSLVVGVCNAHKCAIVHAASA